MASLERSDVLQWLRTLPEEEFAHLLAEACQGRSYRHHDVTDVKYAVVQAWRDEGEPWAVSIIATEDSAAYQGTPFAGGFPTDYGIVQDGDCLSRGQRVVSWAKMARCPICDASLTCT